MVNKVKTNVLVLGDLHVGAKTFNEDLFGKWLIDAHNYCSKKKRKGKGYIILNGDLCDFARASQDAWSSTMTANEQVEYVVEALEPFKEHIIGATTSNHGLRAYKEFNMSIDELIASQLDIPYEIDLFANIPYNKDGDTKKIFVKHGNRFSKSYLLFMRNFINDMNNIQADIYVSGHSHFLGGQTRIIRTEHGIEKKHYVVNGSFLNYLGSYAQSHGYDLKLAGYPIININEAGEVQIIEKWGDM